MLAAKTFDAKPLGVFAAGKQARFYLFERDGKPILIAASDARRAKTCRWPWARSPSKSRTTRAMKQHAAGRQDGVAQVCRLTPMGCFIEGADLDVVKAHLVPAVAVPIGRRQRSAHAARQRPARQARLDSRRSAESCMIGRWAARCASTCPKAG